MPIGSAVHRIGCAQVDGDAITVKVPAVVSAVVGFAPTDAGDVSVSLLDNGMEVAKSTVMGTAGGMLAIPITASTRPCCMPSRLTLSVSVAGTVGEVQASVIG